MIKPKYIRIQNFNNIIDTSLDLSSAVSLFIGDNGSGKTSVVDAIGLCLFEYRLPVQSEIILLYPYHSACYRKYY